MPEITGHRQSERVEVVSTDPVVDRVRDTAAGLANLLQEAEDARRLRSEAAGGEGAGAVCAWNHFENIPTFYNWNNRPR
ncbi:multiple cyclophane-containing RiPP AmcA [Micromonospora sp. RTGN7]|uniref:multiple cyclophane-containing RiPP AmcA n=1 Tax=Micromonospora sp. RTGN7 TaxID=3016526 RepID=UPI0029FEF964|nr:multiple cyclophane-containing RiPP AmcA [Micromonospora sp. RTGN7]